MAYAASYNPTDLTGLGKAPANGPVWIKPEDEDDDLLDLEEKNVVLDPTDPFEDVLISIVDMNRRKRADYAEDGDPWSNFRFTAEVVGITPTDAAIHNVAQKLARLVALRSNGRLDEPKNEAVTDTYLDLAVYAVIALGIHTHPEGRVFP